MWKGPVKRAAKDAGLSDETCAYPLRHSVITDRVTEGLDLFTVAQVSGASVAMIERCTASCSRRWRPGSGPGLRSGRVD